MGVKRAFTTLLLAVYLFAYAGAATPRLDLRKTRIKAAKAFAYCHAHHYNYRYAVLIDMSLPSGLKRMTIWDFAKNDTLFTGLVSHGCGIGPWSGVWSKDKPAFSNALNSHCTSLGKYAITGRGYSQWGIHVKYYLTGLERTTSNAMKREVVFHCGP